MEGNDQIWANPIQERQTVPPVSRNCCIFRVPEVLRRLNEKAYEPDIVAIGPYHRNKRSLRHMEDVKNWYLHDLLSRMDMSLMNLFGAIREFETRARACYQEQFDGNFMDIMILDGCFLVELFRKMADFNLRSLDDPIFNMACMHQYLYHDLLLLENQLPWFILQRLFDLTEPNDQRNHSLPELVLKFFFLGFSITGNREICHILDLIREELVHSYSDNQVEWGHCRIPCVTSLLEAGVIFTRGTGSIMNLNFTNGNFEIPPFICDERTEPFFRNLIAFEQCYRDCPTIITSYAILMDSLINTGKDVEYLVENGIMCNWLSAEDASQFFNRLYNDTKVSNFYYANLARSVNGHYRTKWHRWRATLMRQYFTSPWTIISLIGAIILLVLTFLQTFYSIKQSHF